MIALALALAAAESAPTLSDHEAYGAIWNDVRLNALIGSGNAEAGMWWVLGHDQAHPPKLHIRNLHCLPKGTHTGCSFDLTREVDPASTAPADETEPTQLACTALLKLDEDGWTVVHEPPRPSRGHSQTTMRCRAVG